MVGTSMASVTAAPTTSGTPSRTMAKQPAAVEGLGRVEQGAGGVDALGLDPEAAHGLHRLGGEAEVAHDRDLGPEMASTTGSRARPPSSFTAWAPARIRVAALRTASSARDVVAHPGHVAHDQAGGLARATAATWWAMTSMSTCSVSS